MKSQREKEKSVDYEALERSIGVERVEEESDAPSSPLADDDFKGDVSLIPLMAGVMITLEHVTALRDYQFSGIVPAALFLRMPFGQDRPIVQTPLLRPYHPDLADAAVMATLEPSRLDVLVREGQSFSTLGVIAIAEQIEDAGLAELVRKAQHASVLKPIFPSMRTRALANELFASEMSPIAKDLQAKSCALELLANALEVLGLTGNDPYTDGLLRAKMDDVRNRLIAQPQARLQVQELARELGMSGTTLRRHFVNTYGLTLGEFQRDLRLLMAYEGIVEKGWTASEAAYRVGYKHPSSFSHAFKHRFGVTPSGARGAVPDQKS
ncbi:MAG: AraC family transcriptional regulator [Pseudomonadota bacterium]